MRAKGFSMDVLAYDPYIDKSFVQDNGVTVATFEELLGTSDFISLHVPLNEHTRNIIDEKAIDKMKQGAVVINTSRGGLIDEKAAYQALKSGKLGGLGLDAFEKEPPGDSPLFELDNVIATPHTGAHTFEAVENMGVLAVHNLMDVLRGKECRFVVNKK